MTSHSRAMIAWLGVLVASAGCGEKSDPLDVDAPVGVAIACEEKSIEVIDVACFPDPFHLPWAIRDATGRTNIYAFTVSIDAQNGSWSFNGWDRQEYSVKSAEPPVVITVRAIQANLDGAETSTLNWLCAAHSCCSSLCCEYQDVRSWFDSYWMASSVRINSRPWRVDTLNIALEQEITFVYSR